MKRTEVLRVCPIPCFEKADDGTEVVAKRLIPIEIPGVRYGWRREQPAAGAVRQVIDVVALVEDRRDIDMPSGLIEHTDCLTARADLLRLEAVVRVPDPVDEALRVIGILAPRTILVRKDSEYIDVVKRPDDGAFRRRSHQDALPVGHIRSRRKSLPHILVDGRLSIRDERRLLVVSGGDVLEELTERLSCGERHFLFLLSRAAAACIAVSFLLRLSL